MGLFYFPSVVRIIGGHSMSLARKQKKARRKMQSGLILDQFASYKSKLETLILSTLNSH